MHRKTFCRSLSSPSCVQPFPPMFFRTFLRRTIPLPVFPMSETWTATTSAPAAMPQHTTDQLNSTALKWGDDGELSDLDLQRILKLLSQADPVAEALLSAVEDPKI